MLAATFQVGIRFTNFEVAIDIQHDNADAVPIGRELPTRRAARQSHIDQTPVALS